MCLNIIYRNQWVCKEENTHTFYCVNSYYALMCQKKFWAFATLTTATHIMNRMPDNCYIYYESDAN